MYTNIVDIPDSILFLTSCRLAIKETVMTNADLEQEDRYELANFVMNEASDYQVMNIVVNDEFVEEKYSLEDEINLFDQYREMVVDNIYEFAGVMESEDLHTILYEIGPVSQHGISTAVPILEFLYESGVIQEKTKKERMRDLYASGKGAVTKFGKDVKSGYGFERSGIGVETGRKVKGTGQKIGATGGKVVGGLKAAKKKTGELASGAVKKGQSAKAAVGRMAGDVGMGFKKQQRGYKAMASKSQKVGAAIGSAKSGVARAGQLAKKGAQAAGSAVMKNKKVAAATALAAAAIYGGVKAYQRFFGAAAKACGGRSGAEKTACMAKARKSAISQQISATQRGMAACANAKNPDKCRAAISSRVSKLKGKLAAA